jgi:hypothetical protein
MITKQESNENAAMAPQSAPVAPERNASRKVASRKKSTPRRQKTARGAKPRKQARTGKKTAPKAATPGTESKSSKILGMIGRAKGATLAEIMTATGWQAHSVRGFLSTAGRKHNVKIDSAKNEGGERTYRIAG